MCRASKAVRKDAGGPAVRRALLGVMSAGLMIAPYNLDVSFAQSVLPQGGAVVSGQAQIGVPSARALTITQTSSKAVIDWNSFSVGPAGAVNFVQPNSLSAILNRVTGSTSSTIAGQIAANGQVFLVNPNGIAITPTGSVQVGGGFVASTLDIRNADFNAGNFNFQGKGTSASVSNEGVISGAAGGFAGLIGGTVSNAGTIAVPLGKVGLGSGEQVTIDPTGDGFLQITVPAGAAATDGRALVDVAGRIRTAGGSIEIKAATAQQAVRDAVNISGSLSARSATGRSGSIVLEGGAGGNVIVSGKLSAIGGKQSKGGFITVSGRNIELRGAIVDVSGGTGGGTVMIGGGPRGQGTLLRAESTTVDQNSTIKADATVNGNGGNVTVWADGATAFGGYIRARGGPQFGNGGQVEVSGKTTLNLTGDYTKTPLANLTARNGKAGTILFDPGTVNILDQTSLSGNSALNGPDTFTAQFLSSQLSSANVTIDTNNATGANGTAGDINLMSNAQISWTSNNNLTLNAARNINLLSGASIAGTGSGASLTLRADSGSTGIGTVSFAGGTQVSLLSGVVDLYYNPASNRTAANGGTNAAAGTVNAASYTGSPAAEAWSSFINAGTLRSWMLVNNVYDLQNINNNLAANYALGANIDASATSAWNAGAGFAPLGTSGAGFVGMFDGLGRIVSSLTINLGLTDGVGLFGYINGGSISNVGLVNASVTGLTNVGGLAGVNSGGTIGTSFVTGAVSGSLLGGVLANVGGFVGRNGPGGTIGNSYATSTVQTSLLGTAGGLVGTNDGSIVSSYATGATGGLLAISGGLVGSNSLSGSISQSYFDNQTTGQFSGVGLGSSVGVTGLTTSIFQNGSLPAGLSSAFWTAASGQYPLLNWQLSGPSSSPSTNVFITATDSSFGSPVYGNATPTFNYAVTDALGNVLCTINCSTYFTGAPLIDTILSSVSPAGTSATGYIAQGSLVAQSGYSLQFVNDTLNVNTRPLTITASDQSKSYGAVASLGTTAFTTSGLVNSDSITSVSLASSGSGTAATVAGGPYAITASSALGIGLSNYAVGYANGLLTVTPAPVNVTALGGSSTYGSLPSNPGLSATGLQNGESAIVLTGLSNSFGITNVSNAGSYLLSVVGSLTNANYTVAGANVGNWTVNPAQVNVTALGGFSTYGSSPSNPGLSATGLQNGQSVNVLTGLSNSFGITNASNAGSYLLSVIGSLTNANYTVAGTNAANWTVNPAQVNVTALGGSSMFGSSPSNPGLSATGLQNGEGASVLTGLLNSFGITNASGVGSYLLSVAGALTNTNYTVASANTGTWTITPLRGSLIDGSSPSIPGLSIANPQIGQSASVSSGIGNLSGIVNTGDLGRDKPGIAGSSAKASYPIVGANAETAPAANPVQVNAGSSTLIPFVGEFPFMAANVSPSAKATCPGGNTNGPADAMNFDFSSVSGISFSRQSQDCSASTPKKAAGLINLTLSKLNRNALFEALDREFSELKNSDNIVSASLTKMVAGTSIAATVGFVGWLLRGGALLSALMSSMPLWRGFDPLIVVLRPKRRKKERQHSSKVDIMFDGARGFKYSTQGLKP